MKPHKGWLMSGTRAVTTLLGSIFEAKDGGINAIKTLPLLTNQVQTGIRSILQAAGTLMSKTLFPAFSVPIIVIPSMLTPFQNIKIAT